MKSFLSSILAIITFFALGCSANDNPPEYIKSVVAYKEGLDALMIYIILADSRGEMTTADGKIHLSIREEGMKWDEGRLVTTSEILYEKDFYVMKADFRNAKVGIGAFERKALIYPVGRIRYLSFKRLPTTMTGKVQVNFNWEGVRFLKGETMVIF